MIDLLQLENATPTDVRSEHGKLIVTVEPSSDDVPLCPQCGQKMYKHGKRTNNFADTPIQMQPVVLEVIRTRYRCSACNTMHTPELSFLDDKRRATHRLIQAVRSRCLDKTFSALGEDTGLVVNTIKNIALDYIEELENTVQFETPTIMGIDELNVAGGMRCVITNIAMRSMYDLLEDRTQNTLIPYFRSLPNPENVEWVCTDMWRPFKRSFSPFLPNAKLVIDKFHVVRMASEALEKERKKLQALHDKSFRLYIKKSLRWLTLKRPDSLNEEELEALEQLGKYLPELKMAYEFKEAFYQIYDFQNKDEAMTAFEQWADHLPQELPAFKEVVKTVNNHREDIFAYWDSPVKISNAYTECNNGLIKVANRLGRGYTFEVLRAKMLYNKEARRITTMGTIMNSGRGRVTSTTGNTSKVTFPTKIPRMVKEYGAHIPTLEEIIFDEES
ncbi:MAG: ISL3 family transposase [Gammaproteobacteria bacterium]|nr:ISL3 family transposase [Gammaproteobacteria bacterium]